jgi:CO/xanthine dehydrogenase Mo-binding subunit
MPCLRQRIGSMDNPFAASVRRRDAAEKTTGRAIYGSDIVLPGMLHAKVLRSSRRHARIVAIDASAARAYPGVHAVITGADLGDRVTPDYGYFIKDQPMIAAGTVRYEGDIIAAVAADTEAAAVAALGTIRVVYADLPAVSTIEEALAPDAPELFPEAPAGTLPRYGTGASATLRPRPNVCYEFAYRTGDPAAFEACDTIFEDEFRFSRMQHCHLEPFVCVATATPDRVDVWSSTQNPFSLRRELARVFRLAENRVRVNVPLVGGSFGAKSNCKAEPVAILLAQRTGKPVRFCMSFEEGFFTNTQHAAILRLKTGVMRDGRLVARQSQIFLDAGAYSGASPLVAEKAGYRIPGPYRYAFIDTHCACVMTNTTPAGAFRGFGGAQTTWASESQIDMIARRLGITPYEMRSKNLLHLGDPFVPGESAIDSDLHAGLDLVIRELGATERTANRGVGIAIGLKDGGGINKAAQARVKISTGGDVFLDCASVEIGQGARSSLAQIVAAVLCTPVDRVRISAIDTDQSPFDAGTNASSAIVVMGRAVAEAAGRVRDDVLSFAARSIGCERAELTLEDWHAVRGASRHPIGPMVTREFGGVGFQFSAEGFQKAQLDEAAPLETQCVFWEVGWAAVEVEVDPETGKVTVEKLVVSGDAGKAINPLACRGQDEGAAVMGLGQALFEQMIYDDGHLRNGDPLEYRLPLAGDLPKSFVSLLQEQGHGPGPFGAKGFGEGGMLPIAAAIANAIDDAAGVRLTELPLTPQRVFDALHRSMVTAGGPLEEPA